jgi:hypothetical protein
MFTAMLFLMAVWASRGPGRGESSAYGVAGFLLGIGECFAFWALIFNALQVVG